jgi:3-oxoacyl-[acyl-carrier-protein] synthase III
MIRAKLLGTGQKMPNKVLTTEEVLSRSKSSNTPDEMIRKTGIHHRSWVDSSETAISLATAALTNALTNANLQPEDLHRIIFVCSTGGDFMIPANVNGVLNNFNIFDSCDGFDLNNACMGFLSALDLAARCVATGMGPVGVVAVETLSRHLTPEDPRPYMVLADAAGAAIVGPTDGDQGVMASTFGNDGRHMGTVTMAHPGLSQKTETIKFAQSNREISKVAIGGLMRCAKQTLAEASLTFPQIDWFVPHQPNGSMLASLIKLLEIPEEKVVPIVGQIGSVGSASTAVGLDILRKNKPVKQGDKVLLFGVGAGMSYGAILWRI